MRVHMSRIAALASSPRRITFVTHFMMLLRGVKKPLAAGRIMAACRSLPIVVWRSFSGIDFLRRSPWALRM